MNDDYVRSATMTMLSIMAGIIIVSGCNNLLNLLQVES